MDTKSIEILSEHKVAGQNVRVMKSENDAMAIRISAGGKKDLGYYVNFRGDDLDEVEKTLAIVTKAFKQFKKRHDNIKK